MKVNGKSFRSIWRNRDGGSVDIIDQTVLPHEFVIRPLHRLDEAAEAISTMRVRGAPLIGATAAYGMALAMREQAEDGSLDQAQKMLMATRPTAVNLRWALSRMGEALRPLPPAERSSAAYDLARQICDEDVAINSAIGAHGFGLIQRMWEERAEKGGAFHILTHCNAGWLATVDWGTALAPIYRAHDAGVPVHVWVDETRPRNQGAALTAWELDAHRQCGGAPDAKRPG
jgi:methylthioribose-1-phosphate isomerase